MDWQDQNDATFKSFIATVIIECNLSAKRENNYIGIKESAEMVLHYLGDDYKKYSLYKLCNDVYKEYCKLKKE